MGLFDFFTKKKEKKKVEEIEFDYKRPEDINQEIVEIDIPDIEFVVDNRDKNVPTILLMDDFKGMTTLLCDELKRVECCDIYSNYNVAVATGDYAAFIVEKALSEGLKVDVAFLDITLGGVVNNVEYDGVDVAIMIKDKYPDSLVKFVTGHTLNRKNPEIFQFIKKFEEHFNTNIEDTYEVQTNQGTENIYKHIIQKNSDRVLLMERAILEYNEKSN